MHPVPWWWHGPAPYAVGPFAVMDANNPGPPRVGACLEIMLDDMSETGRTAMYVDDIWMYPCPDPLLTVEGDTIRLSDAVYLRAYRPEDAEMYEAAGRDWGVPGWAAALAMIGGWCDYDEREEWLDAIRRGSGMGTRDPGPESPGDWVYPRR